MQGQITFSHPPSKSQAPKKSEKSQTDPSHQKLEHLVDKTSTPLLKVSSISIPFLFPWVEVTVDLRKITLNKTTFFWTHEVITILNEQLVDVSLETTLFWGTLRITYRGETSEEVIPYLPLSQAHKAKQVLTGVITSMKENIKLGDLNPEKDLSKISEVGKAGNPPKES